MTTVKVAGVAVDTRHLIGGERVGSSTTFEVFSPIDRGYLADVAAGGAGEARAAVQAARDAFPAWAALGPDGRGNVLDRFADGIIARNDELAAVETEDNGSLLLGNTKNVIKRGAHNVRFFADFARKLSHPPIVGDVVDNCVSYDPAGVAVLVTPWNAPFMLSTWKVGPALAAGNTVVLKPPEWAPLTCSILGDIAIDAGIPAGVLNIVQGAGVDVGAPLTADPEVARISFTGSTATARVIGHAAADNLTPVSFELGGKSPFIVLDDADLDDAARTIAHQFINAGQVCLAGTRVLAHAAIADELLALVAIAKDRLPVGDPRELATRVGPLIHPRQHDRVSGLVERAIAAGARPLFGGRPHPAGDLYYEPTLLADVVNDAEIVQEEVFGPVLTWQTFGDDDEGIALANSTRYGLAAMVFTHDRGRAERVASRLTAGTVWVNCFFVRDLAAPFGGARESGIGREGGAWSFDFFSDVKNVAVRRGSFEGDSG